MVGMDQNYGYVDPVSLPETPSNQKANRESVPKAPKLDHAPHLTREQRQDTESVRHTPDEHPVQLTEAPRNPKVNSRAHDPDHVRDSAQNTDTHFHNGPKFDDAPHFRSERRKGSENSWGTLSYNAIKSPSAPSPRRECKLYPAAQENKRTITARPLSSVLRGEAYKEWRQGTVISLAYSSPVELPASGRGNAGTKPPTTALHGSHLEPYHSRRGCDLT